MQIETWKQIDGFSNYFISNIGRVKSTYGTIRKLQVCKKGYNIISIRNDIGKRKTLRIHRLVAIMFIDNPNNLPQVNHKDGNKLNNNLDNLEWSDNSMNQKHAFSLGLQTNLGENNPRSILTKEDVIKIRLLHLQGNSYFTISNVYNVSKSTVASVITGKNWSDI